MTSATQKSSFDSLIQEAEDAFWQVIGRRFPQARSGDLSIGRTFAFSIAVTEAVHEWISNNVTTQEAEISVGYRFKLFRNVDRFPDFLAPAGLTGTITLIDDSGIWGKMDQPMPGAEQWDNQIHWQTPEEFPGDTEPV
jgi:hypothetical protein